MKKYVLGNWLRGYFEGEFSSIDEAFSWLSNRFLLSYPSVTGRHVCMWVYEANNYGIKELVLCRSGDNCITEINNLPKEEVLAKCKEGRYSFL